MTDTTNNTAARLVQQHHAEADELVASARDLSAAGDPAGNDAQVTVVAKADELRTAADDLVAKADRIQRAADAIPPVEPIDEWIEAELEVHGDHVRRVFAQIVEASESRPSALASAMSSIGRQSPGWLIRAVRAELDEREQAAFDKHTSQNGATHAAESATHARMQTDQDHQEGGMPVATSTQADASWLDLTEGFGSEFKADDVREEFCAQIATGKNRPEALTAVLEARGLPVPERITQMVREWAGRR